MDRNKGTFNFAANFETLTKAPLDARQVVKNFSGLTQSATWADLNGDIWLYDGAIVAVTNDTILANNGVYYLKDAANYNQPANWVKLESVSGGTYTFIQSGATVIVTAGSDVTIYTPVAPTDLSGFTDNTNLLFDKQYSGLSGAPNLNLKLDVAVFTGFTGTTLPNDYYDKVEVDGLISGFTTGNTFTQSGTTVITQQGDNVNIYTPPTNFSGYWTSGQTSLAISAATSGLTGNTIYNLESPAAVTVGGITVGTTLTGKTSNELLEEILVPTLYPSFSNPSSTFVKSLPAANLFEIAEVDDIDFASAFSRGTISPAYGTSGNRSGLPSFYNYTGSGLPASVPSSSLSDNQSATGYTILQGNQSWSGNVDFLIGEQPKNSKGGNYDSPYAAGTSATVTRTIEGVYPLYGTTVAIATLTKQTLVSMLTGNNIAFAMVAETGGNKQKFEIPDAWLSGRALVGVQTWNSVSSTWEYQGGNAVNSLTYWTTSADTQTIQGNVINYTKHQYNGTDRAAISIRLVF